MAKRGKDGKPKAKQVNDDAPDYAQEPTMEEFIRDMHGSSDTPQDGLPSMDFLKSKFETTSAMIRYLTSLGHQPKVIAKHLGIRYQHARNVANSELKRGPNEDWRKPYIESTTIPDLKHFKPVNKLKPSDS